MRTFSGQGPAVILLRKISGWLKIWLFPENLFSTCRPVEKEPVDRSGRTVGAAQITREIVAIAHSGDRDVSLGSHRPEREEVADRDSAVTRKVNHVVDRDGINAEIREIETIYCFVCQDPPPLCLLLSRCEEDDPRSSTGK
ncbi:hypothetical protein L484_012031 [Morus notabilis]|uniref:Uncharacterized protein n=1 Tax=Morus notabilis TaxID=981085 RepID=W9QS70_9ROSA|nr:hypothetical protein L484_012031 [Morus notabilis]